MFTDATSHEQDRQQPRFWFGVAGGVVSWFTLGSADVGVAFAACTHQETYGVPNPHPDLTPLFAVMTVILFITTITAGVISYRNWRRISADSGILNTIAVDHREFLSLLGVIISVTLSASMVWFALPPLFLDLCWRAR